MVLTWSSGITSRRTFCTSAKTCQGTAHSAATVWPIATARLAGVCHSGAVLATDGAQYVGGVQCGSFYLLAIRPRFGELGLDYADEDRQLTHLRSHTAAAIDERTHTVSRSH